jgi:hypothetical protein
LIIIKKIKKRRKNERRKKMASERTYVKTTRRLAPGHEYKAPPIVPLPFSEDKSLLFFGEGKQEVMNKRVSSRQPQMSTWNPKGYAPQPESLWEKRGSETEESKRIARAIAEHKHYLEGLMLHKKLKEEEEERLRQSSSSSFPMTFLSSLPPPSRYDGDDESYHHISW